MEEINEPIVDNQRENTDKRVLNILPHQWKKGQSGNPKGRPKGMTAKERAKEYLVTMTDDEFEEFLSGIDKKTIWEMAEGKPKQDVDTKVDGTLNITWHEHNDTLQTENTDAGVSQL